MKKKCSDETYHTANDLEELLDEIESKVKTYDKKRQELYWRIQKEKKEDPSVVLVKVEEKVEQGVLPEMKLEMPEEKPQVKICRYHSKGVCKRGQTCRFLHPDEDCSEYISLGKCSMFNCQKRHRAACKYFKRKKGCNRPMCPYVHEQNEHSENLKFIKLLKRGIN